MGHPSVWPGRTCPIGQPHFHPVHQALLPAFLPEVGKALGLPQLLPVAPLRLWAEAPEPRGQQSKAKMPQADLLAGSEAAEVIKSSGAPVLGPVGPSVMVMGARGGKRKGIGVVLNCKGHPSFGMGCFCSHSPLLLSWAGL